jgi:hypothetical protein
VPLSLLGCGWKRHKGGKRQSNDNAGRGREGREGKQAYAEVKGREAG